MKIKDQRPKTEDQNFIDWMGVRRVLVVRLRSIGDTVLATPSLIALRRFLPEAQIDVLLEDWVAPVLEGFDAVDNVLTIKKDDLKSTFQMARRIRQSSYDVAYNLHGGTTGTFFVRASGARHRIGYENYRYKFLYTRREPSSAIFWQRDEVHSAEQQLALLGFTGVPVSDRPKTHLAVTEKARLSIESKLKSKLRNPNSKIALIHPATAFETKKWAIENYVRIVELLHDKGLSVVAAASPQEREVLESLERAARVPIDTYTDLSLPEITALAARAALFVGNDSGIAHIASATGTPAVVIFGSSNRVHWRPWTDAPHEIVYEEMPCQPCAGFFCKEFGVPECIRRVTVEMVTDAIERVMSK